MSIHPINSPYSPESDMDSWVQKLRQPELGFGFYVPQNWSVRRPSICLGNCAAFHKSQRIFRRFSERLKLPYREPKNHNPCQKPPFECGSKISDTTSARRSFCCRLEQKCHILIETFATSTSSQLARTSGK